ncbi:MAG: cytochrome c oxidase subunit 3 [Burkholderiales bacterium]|nr:cytochrome c oxidase subunit 3 [Burkholderiales bacterium]
MATHQPAYFVPHPSKWPLVGAFALFFIGLGAAFVVNAIQPGWYSLGLGAAILIYMLFGWFGDVIRESEGGVYSKRVDISFRWGMGWFIFSEVMFFAAFFGTLFYVRQISVPTLGDVAHKLLWPDFIAQWPRSVAPHGTAPYDRMEAWGLPAWNTAILLTSGVTLTIAHHALVKNNRGQLKLFLLITVLLGALFLGCQAHEYAHAWGEGLTLASGVYGSTFYMMTGFHGMHVFIGALMLTVMWFRSLKGHFKPEHHFAFEAAAWYWHFVDVVWLVLFVFVYWL